MKIRLDSWLMIGAGAILTAVISCVAATSNTPPTTSNETATWTDTMVASSAKSTSVSHTDHDSTYSPFYTPFPFSAILGDSYQIPTTLTTLTSGTVADRSRYLISPSAGSYLSIGTPSDSDSTTVTANSATATYADILAKVVEAVPDAAVSHGFRLDSDLHALYSVDVGSDGTTLVFHNNWGTAPAPTGRGYLVFTYDASTKFLKAAARYTYDLSDYSHTADGAFTKAGYYVKFASGVFSLDASSSNAALTFTNSPVDVTTPTNYNPDSIAYQPNPRVVLSEHYLENKTSKMEGETGDVQHNLAADYTDQVAAVGDNAGTAAAAAAMLDTIEDDLKAEGSSLRYSKKVYLAFRKAALNVLLKSDDIANGTLGMHAVPYVYFTNATEGGTSASPSGTHHPFMVIAAYSVTDKPNRLVDVSRPPGDGLTDSYTTQKVTRDATIGLYLIKIPLKDYGLTTSLSDNTYQGSLKADAASGDADSVYNLASTSGLGVAVDGSPLYPVLNNTLATSQNNAELTSIGNHVGRGMELHYHADGHIAKNNDLQLYNINDYEGEAHPPLIGFGFDGLALYGVYENAYKSMEGIDTPLDAWGGHSHGVYGYHYHSHIVSTKTLNGQTYQLDVLIKGAWKGKINNIPEFWEKKDGDYTGKPAYALSQDHRYVGKTY